MTTAIQYYEQLGAPIRDIQFKFVEHAAYWYENIIRLEKEAEEYKRYYTHPHVDIVHNCWIRVVDSGHPEWIEIASRIYYKGQPWNQLTKKRAKDDRNKQKAIKDMRNLQKITAQLRDIAQHKVQTSSEYGCTGQYPRGMSCPYVFRLYDSIDCRK